MVAVLVVNGQGLALASRLIVDDNDLKLFRPEALPGRGGATFTRLGDQVRELFHEVDGFIFIMASGIAVRTLAPLLRDKTSDPGVVVVDEAGDFVVSLVGGHEGGANALAYRVAGIIGAVPVITTGSEAAKDVVVGVGCRRNAGASVIQDAVHESLQRAGISLSEVKCLSTFDGKRDDCDLLAAAERLGLPVRFFSRETLRGIGAQTTISHAAQRAFGIEGVCEPAALAVGRDLQLVLTKQIFSGVTVAIARRNEPEGPALTEERASETPAESGRRGSLAIIGIGQGGDTLTLQAQKALERATDVVGYRTYIRALAEHLGERRTHEFGMGDELERVRRAAELASAGRDVALVSSGDAGIYGMAGPLLEFLGDAEAEFEIDIIPGVTAAAAAAAAVGAPLMNDFAVISLSDIMTSWSEIERRIEAAAGADLVIAIYNPKSSRRREQFEQARLIILRHRAPSTPAAVIRNAGTSPEVTMTDLAGLADAKIDMRCTVIVGNSQTRNIHGRLVTGRGYRFQ